MVEGGCAFVPKALCVLSHYPLFTAFRTILCTLYRLACSPGPCLSSLVFDAIFQSIPQHNLQGDPCL